MNTAEALDSKHWLSMSMDGIQEFLGMTFLDVKETELVTALIIWGKNKLQRSNNHDNGGKLRAEILPGLKLIKFDALSLDEFHRQCLGELGAVLSESEQRSISASILAKNPSLMPAEFKPSEPVLMRHRPIVVCQLPYVEKRSVDARLVTSSKLSFQIDQKATLVGLKVRYHQYEESLLTFSLVDDSAENTKVVGKGNWEVKFAHMGERYCKVTHRRALEANTKYTLLFKLLNYPKLKTSYNFSKCVVNSDWLTLTMVDSPNMNILVESLVFEKLLSN